MKNIKVTSGIKYKGGVYSLLAPGDLADFVDYRVEGWWVSEEFRLASVIYSEEAGWLIRNLEAVKKLRGEESWF